MEFEFMTADTVLPPLCRTFGARFPRGREGAARCAFAHDIFLPNANPIKVQKQPAKRWLLSFCPDRVSVPRPGHSRPAFPCRRPAAFSVCYIMEELEAD